MTENSKFEQVKTSVEEGEAQSFDIDGFDSSDSALDTNSRSYLKYKYISPKVTYGIVAVLLLGIAAIIAGSVTTSVQSEPAKWNPSSVEGVDVSELDTNRPLMTFQSAMTEDVTYKQKTELSANSTITMIGQTETTHVEMNFEDSLLITDLHNGGKEIHYTISRLALESITNDEVTMSFDSESDDNDDEVAGVFNEFLGETSIVQLDKYNKVVSATFNEALLEQMQDKTPGLSAAEQYEQTSRMAQALPFKAVKPNDSWNLSMNVKEERYDGTVTLLGYTDYDGVDVAVFKLSATVSLDLGQVAGEMGGEVGELLTGTTIKDGKVEGFMYWDLEYHFPRWTSQTIEMTIEMPNPLDADEMFEIPTVEKVVMYMGI